MLPRGGLHRPGAALRAPPPLERDAAKALFPAPGRWGAAVRGRAGRREKQGPAKPDPDKETRVEPYDFGAAQVQTRGVIHTG